METTARKMDYLKSQIGHLDNLTPEEILAIQQYTRLLPSQFRELIENNLCLRPELFKNTRELINAISCTIPTIASVLKNNPYPEVVQFSRSLIADICVDGTYEQIESMVTSHK